jgi:hypothetical protein
MSDKTPKDKKQSGTLNNHGSVPKVNDQIVRTIANTLKTNKDGSYEITMPPSPVITGDHANTTTMRFTDGRYVELNSDFSWNANINIAYGPHGIRNGMVILAEGIAKGTTVKDPYAMALVWLARVGLSTTKKMVVEDHGETYGFWKALLYGVAANTKLTTPGYFTGAFKGSKRFQAIAHASHELHHALDFLTFKKIGRKGTNSTLGSWSVQPLNFQIGANQIEQKFLSGQTVFYALKGKGHSNGGHGNSESEKHPQNKIESDTHTKDVKNSHNAKSAESHANAIPAPVLDKEGAKELLLELGQDKETQQVLWIAWNLNEKARNPGSLNLLPLDGLGSEMVDLTKVQITEDIAFAQELLNKSGLNYYQATKTQLKDLPNNIINGVAGVIADTGVIDFIRFAWNSLGFGDTDAEAAAKKRAAYLISLQADGAKITYNPDGSVTIKVNPKDALKAKSDNARLPSKVSVTAVQETRAQKAEQQKQADKAYEKLVGWNAYNMNVNSAEYKQFQVNKTTANFQNTIGNLQSNQGVGIPLVTGGVRSQQTGANRRVSNQLFNKN